MDSPSTDQRIWLLRNWQNKLNFNTWPYLYSSAWQVTMYVLPINCGSWIRRSVLPNHYCDVIMGTTASQIISLTIVYSIDHSGADERKISKLRITGLCERNSPLTGDFRAQVASNAEIVSIWWRHHSKCPSKTKWYVTTASRGLSKHLI